MTYLLNNRKSPKFNNSLAFTYSLFFFAVIMTLFFQATWRQKSWFSNIYIPDELTLYEELRFIITNGISMENYIKSSEDSRTICFIYLPLYVLFAQSSVAFIVQNIIMTSFAIFASYQSFSRFGRNASFFSSLAISANPYVWIGIAGISKEIVLLLITTLIMMVFTAGKLLRSLLIALLCYFAYGVRPFYGFALVIYLIPCLLLSDNTFFNQGWKKVFRLAIILIPFLMVASFTILREYIPLLDRMILIQQDVDAITTLGKDNLERTLSSLDSGAIFSCIDLIFRSFANVFSLMIRPSLTTESNRVALLGFGFWIYGLLLAISIFFTLVTFLNYVKSEMKIKHHVKIFQDKEKIIDIMYFILYMTPMISTSLILQPRYLMPILPVSMGMLGLYPCTYVRNILILFLAASLLGYVYLTYFVDVEPLKIQDSIYKPEFILHMIVQRGGL